ncbi:hypothetical protein LTS18_012061, partial [Coniosporium uncinatum]
LKSHAYMYESTPQEIIDEESHPGILHGAFDHSSSSSSSSDNSSSDTDTTSGSVTTTRRIKRAFRRQLRRKSNASSTQAPSALTSPSLDAPNSFFESHGHPTPPDEDRGRHIGHGLRRGSTLGAITSGDEADDDRDRTATRVRDFVEKEGSVPRSPESVSDGKARKKRNSKENRHRHRQHRFRKQPLYDEKEPIRDTPVATNESESQPRVGIVADTKDEAA